MCCIFLRGEDYEKILLFFSLLMFGIQPAYASVVYQQYDENGRLVQEQGGNHSDIYTYEYDDNGNITAETHYPCYSSGCSTVPSYQYRNEYQNGNLVSTTQYRCNGSTTCTSAQYQKRFEYDAAGNQTTYTWYTDSNQIHNNIPQGQERYTYDANGNLLTKVTYSGVDNINNNVPYSGFAYEYDQDGNEISMKHYGSGTNYLNNTPGYQHRYEYQNGQKVLDAEYYCSGSVCSSLQTEIRYAYDEKGNMISELKYICRPQCQSSPYSSKIYTYDYDEYGNIINKYENGNLIETRTYANPGYQQNLASNSSGGSGRQYKRIYTVEEAEKVSKPTGNKIMLRYK